MRNLKDYTTLDLCHLIRDRELERLTAEQKDTLTKELDASSEKNKEEMVGLRDGMAELLDERVRVCQTKFFSSVFSGAIALKQISGGSGEGAIAAAAWTSGGTACTSKEGQSDFVGMTR